jgi:hypothetical protein
MQEIHEGKSGTNCLEKMIKVSKIETSSSRLNHEES